MTRKPIRPWKKNIRRMPNAVRIKIANGSGPLIVATTKKISADVIGQGLYTTCPSGLVQTASNSKAR